MYELPIRMASLQIAEECEVKEPVSESARPGENSEVSSSPIGRVLRDRVTVSRIPKSKRCKLPPKKYCLHTPDLASGSAEELAALYTSKGGRESKPFKCLLETIYEEPLRHKNGSLISVGVKKVKRTITFPTIGTISKSKQRIRKAKSKMFFKKFNLKQDGQKRESLDRILAKLEKDDTEDLSNSEQ